MARRHLPSSGIHCRRRPSCLWRAADQRSAAPDYTIDELAFPYPEVIFRTVAAAAADADMRFYDAAIVWRLPCGAYVWTPADVCRVMSIARLIPLSQLWFAEAYDRLDSEFAGDAIGAREVLWRDCGDGSGGVRSDVNVVELALRVVHPVVVARTRLPVPRRVPRASTVGVPAARLDPTLLSTRAR